MGGDTGRKSMSMPVIICVLFTVAGVVFLHISNINNYVLISNLFLHTYEAVIHRTQITPINNSNHREGKLNISDSSQMLTMEKVTKTNVGTNISAACDLCNDYDWVFIIATGRSGSTTILDMLDTIEGVQLAGELKVMHLFNQIPFIGGENKLKQYQFTRTLEKAGIVRTRTKGAFKHGEIDLHEIYCDLQNLIRDLIGYKSSNADKLPKIVGFKSLFANNEMDGDSLLQFWSRVFPCARFILNYRLHTEKQATSGFYQTYENATIFLQRRNKQLLSFSERADLRDRVFKLPLSSFSLGRFNALLHWLGFSNCSYTNVVHAHYQGSYKDVKSSVLRNVTSGKCHYKQPKIQAKIETKSRELNR